MFEKTNQGEEPGASAPEAAESQSESGRKADPQEEPHGDHCRCTYCARERDEPLGGPSDGRAGHYVPLGEGVAFLRRMSRPVLAVAWQVRYWTRRTILWRVRAVLSKARHRVLSGARRSIIPWLRSAGSWCRCTWPVRIVARQWSRVTPRTRQAALALCAVTAAILLLLGIRGWVVDSLGAIPRGGAAAVAGEGVLPAPVESHGVSRPVLVQVRLGSPQAVWTASTRHRRQLAGLAARQILPALGVRPHQLVVIELKDIPLSFSQLPAADQGEVHRRVGPFAAKRYESAVAALLDATIDTVAEAHPHAVLSVRGLPIEPEDAGMSLEMARRSNERYGTVIDALGPFVSPCKLVVSGSTLDETLLARMGMREALRLRDGRPIVVQMNTGWQALADSEGLGYQEYVVARASGRLKRHRASPGPGGGQTEVQVLLGDDPYWDP
jgi:hypothetical protein